MKRILLALGFCFPFFVAEAQNYEPGYIVHTDQDTIHGYILNAPDSEYSNGVNFRIDPQSMDEFFEPGDIQAFGFSNGRTFSTRVIPGNRNKPAKPVFAKNLVKGKIDLYIWNHPQRYKPDFFVVNTTTGEEVHLKRPEINPADRKQRKVRRPEKIWQEDLKRVLQDNEAVSEDLKYSEKAIKKEILAYNSQFEEAFPVEAYSDKTSYNLNILVGVPVSFDINFKSFRGAVFLEKFNPDRTNNFILTRGIIYHHNTEPKETPVGLENGEFLFRTQLINLVPIAVKFQGNSKRIQPYGYAGVGAAVSWEENVVVENGSQAGTSKDTKFLPTVNAGIGARIKSGSHALIAELTPTLNRVFFNIGFSF
ncbi:hypothetical protein LZ575_06800 [Antarcticibacterium sp. 1MA-6-2]|uniref:hypothetical protein n=1 Tax=Antarcticibacterium sp. 1MA-6-2 TaxID=2908210 RepID=UPI001F4008E4|nr:hypothetical protein [Antarcticibacterium sp. 1MA-6-2]UJH92259.1 hypothetical protein LZ575_06800 [Antarcticibacterium sp. 1MA-6-2]